MSGKQNKPLNLWKTNNIPAPEFCRLDRAAELLGCHVSDIIHLFDIGAIDLCVRFYGREERRLRLVATRENDLKFFTEADGNCGAITFSPLARVERLIADDKNLDTHNDEGAGENYFSMFDYSTIPYGFWFFTGKREAAEDYRSVGGDLSPYTDSNFVLSEEDYRLIIRGRLVCPPDVQNLCVDHEQYPVQSLWITRSELQKIHNGAGYELPSYINGGIVKRDENEIEKPVRTTAKQADLIVALLKAIGLTDNDLKGSVSQLRSKANYKAGYLPFPDDDKAVIEWLKKGGVNR